MALFKVSKMRRAIQDNRNNDLEIYLKKGWDPEAEDGSTFYTMMQCAIVAGNDRAVELLLEYGAKADRSIYDNMNYLHWLSRLPAPNVRIAEILLEVCPTLLTAGDCDNNTPLHLAAKVGCLELVALLLKKGADPNARNYKYKKPLDIASEARHRDIEDLLRHVTTKFDPKAYLAGSPSAVPIARLSPQDPPEGWLLLNAEKIAHVATEKILRYRIIDVFNFKSRDVLRIVRNLETGAETSETKSMDDMSVMRAVEDAKAELKKRGGKPGVDTMPGFKKG